MRYRARVIPLKEGHRQEDKASWEYTDAVSITQAGRFLRIQFPYPKYIVEEPIIDPRSNPPGKMKIVCAWCNKAMGYKEDEGIEGVTHSICDECYEDMFGMPKFYTITDPGKTIFNTGDVVASGALKRENERVIRLGEMPASAKSKGGV